jgi:hypothetical protein
MEQVSANYCHNELSTFNLSILALNKWNDDGLLQHDLKYKQSLELVFWWAIDKYDIEHTA